MRFGIREHTKEDLNFIFSSWLSHQKQGFPNPIIPSRFYFKGETDRITRLLDKSKVYVACPEDEPTQILAWICITTEPTEVIHYAFTKSSFRKIKLFDSLLRFAVPTLNESDLIASRISKEALDFNLLRKYKIVFNPYIEEKILKL
jgi:hypothetical protein